MDRDSIGIKRHCDVQFIDSKYLKPVEGVMSKLENEVRILVEEVLESWIPENIDFYDNHTKELIGECLTDLEDRMKAYTESCIRVKSQSPEPVKIDSDFDEPTDVIWSALHHLRENVLGESEYANDLWDDICCAMAIIGEGNEPEDDIYDSRDGWQCLYKIAPVDYNLETRQSYCVVNVGDILWLDGEEVKITSLSPPHKPSSTGKIGCVLSDGSGSYEKKSREYFASVFNCQYVYSPIQLSHHDLLIKRPVEG